MSGPGVRLLAQVVGTSPLAVHVALLNPPEAAGPASVPRVLRPAGAFVTAEVRTAEGASAWTSPEVRVGGLKLDPATDAAYVELQPGYAWGALLELDGAPEAPGGTLALRYASAPYDGPRGESAYRLETTVPLPAPSAGGGSR